MLQVIMKGRGLVSRGFGKYMILCHMPSEILFCPGGEYQHNV